MAVSSGCFRFVDRGWAPRKWSDHYCCVSEQGPWDTRACDLRCAPSATEYREAGWESSDRGIRGDGGHEPWG